MHAGAGHDTDVREADAEQPVTPLRPRRWLGRPGPASDPFRPQRTITLMLIASLLLPWITAAIEWRRLRVIRAYFYFQFPWSSFDAAAVWVFAVKTYLVLLPALAVAIALAWRGWARSAVAVFLLGVVLVNAWVGVDLETFTRTGAHLWYYTQFLNAPDAIRWVGDFRTAARDAFVALLPLMGITCGVLVLAGAMATRAWRPRRAGRAGPRLVALLAAAHVLMLVLVAPVQPLLTPAARRGDLQQVHNLMPYDLVWTAPGLRLVDVDVFQGPLNARLEPVLRRAMPTILAGAPADTAPQALIPADGPRPNVVLLILDSLRADVMTPEVMPRLWGFAKEGLVLRRHFAGARMTHLGLFNILYGRPAGTYRRTVRANIPPQGCVSFRAGGYQTNYVAGVPHLDWLQMQLFLNEEMFTRMRIVGVSSFPISDQRALAATRRILRGEDKLPTSGAPQFIATFLVSTHYPYDYPATFATRSPAIDPTWNVLSVERERDRTALLNRYHNACTFLDAAVGDFVDQVDRSNTIIVLTGDHGESFWDDGTITHGNRWSDVQSHVPCVILAPGLKPREIDEPTTHQDLLPTLLHLAAGKAVEPRNASGRDLLTRRPGSLPNMVVTAGEPDSACFQLLVMLRDRRLLLEFPYDRPAVIVRGTVDAQGKVDAHDLPPAADADAWGEELSALLTRMSEIPAPPVTAPPPLPPPPATSTSTP